MTICKKRYTIINDEKHGQVFWRYTRGKIDSEDGEPLLQSAKHWVSSKGQIISKCLQFPPKNKRKQVDLRVSHIELDIMNWL